MHLGQQGICRPIIIFESSDTPPLSKVHNQTCLLAWQLGSFICQAQYRDRQDPSGPGPDHNAPNCNTVIQGVMGDSPARFGGEKHALRPMRQTPTPPIYGMALFNMRRLHNHKFAIWGIRWVVAKLLSKLPPRQL